MVHVVGHRPDRRFFALCRWSPRSLIVDSCSKLEQHSQLTRPILLIYKDFCHFLLTG
ncbi:hypothetical protein Copypasta_CDS0011 [Escherichia phage Copypasta]|nr:hypothetical protein Copypasta_CDS0011 [Escherichia phage Copypasta]